MRIFLTLLLFSLLLISCEKQETPTTKYYKIETLGSGSFQSEVQYLGEVKSDIVSTLSAEVGGKIIDAPRQVGDSLNVGDIVARINIDSTLTSKAGNSNMIDTLLNLKKSVSESYESQKNIIKGQIRQAQIERDASIVDAQDISELQGKENKSIEESIDVIKQNISLAEKELQETENIFSVKEGQLYSNAKNALTAAMMVDANLASYVNDLFEIDTKASKIYDDYDGYLGAKDSSHTRKTEDKAELFYQKYLQIKDVYDASVLNVSNPDKQIIETLIPQVIELNSDAKSLLSDMYTVFDNSISSVGSLSQSEILSHQQKINSFGSQIESALLSASGDMFVGVKGLKQSLETLRAEKQKALSLGNEKISVLRQQLSYAQAQKEMKPVEQRKNLTQNANQTALIDEKIQQLEESLKNIDAQKQAKLDEIQSQIVQIESQNSIFSLNAAKGIIQSPISGVITKKYADLGGVIQPGMPLYEISDTKSKKIVLEVDVQMQETLHIGDSVRFQSEASGAILEAQISQIFPFVNEMTRKIQIEIQGSSLQNIPLGTRVSVFFSQEENISGTIIPKNTLIHLFGNPGVYVIRENIAHFTPVKILSENENSLLVSGLNGNEQVISEGKENISDGENLESVSVLP